MEAQVVGDGRQQLLLVGGALLAQQLLLLGIQLALPTVHLGQRLGGGALQPLACAEGERTHGESLHARPAAWRAGH